MPWKWSRKNSLTFGAMWLEFDASCQNDKVVG